MKEHKFPNKMVETVWNANRILGKIEAVLSIILLWALIVVTMIFISCRFIFHVSTPWADELARYFLIILAWFGGSYAASVGDHLEIDIVSTVLKKKTKNADAILAMVDRIGQCIVLFVMLFFSYYFTLYVQKIDKMGTVSNTMGFKMTLPMTLVLVGCGLIILHTVFNILLPHEYWFGKLPEAGGNEEGEM